MRPAPRPASALALSLALSLALAGCGAFDGVKNASIAELVGLADGQPCTISQSEGQQLTGAYLRRPGIEAQSHDVLYVSGKPNRAGQPGLLAVDDRSLRGLGGDPQGEKGLTGSNRSSARLLPGFAPGAGLPNVYALSYHADHLGYAGTLVIGHSPAQQEIPTSGATSFRGRIVLDLSDPAGAGQMGGQGAVQAVGSFTMTVGYAAQRARLEVDLHEGGLPFTRLSWDNLYLCGGRVVSSGQGQVTVSDRAGRSLPPFQSGAGPARLTSRLEASLFAPQTRPAPPFGLGGVLSVKSDLGAITGVFLSASPEGAAP